MSKDQQQQWRHLAGVSLRNWEEAYFDAGLDPDAMIAMLEGAAARLRSAKQAAALRLRAEQAQLAERPL